MLFYFHSFAIFSCANGEWVTGQIGGGGIGQLTLQGGDAGFTVTNNSIFVGDGTLKVGDACFQLCYYSIFSLYQLGIG